VHGAKGQACRLRLLNAGQCTYVDGWRDYRAVASYDRRDWFRVPTRFDGRELTIEHLPQHDSVYYAYFEPYSWERHLDLVGLAARWPRMRVRRLGASLEHRDIDLITVGEAGSGAKPIWVIARQHPGETMAEWFVDGMLHRLADDADPIARRLLQDAVVYIVPNMNPDGSVRGNLRTNAAGANLNREWMTPTPVRSPEVMCVRAAMEQSGVAMFLDVHGDEGLPYVFVDGCERLPGFTPRHAERQRAFIEAFKVASPDFQDVHGYPSNKDTKVNLTLASKFVGHTFGALSLTLEMPFKDNADVPDQQRGWSGERSKRLGAATLEAMLAVVPEL
jgi:murein tripeptide amidase MpaA